MAQWNPHITEPLYEGAVQSLRDLKVAKEDILTVPVPGSFELPLAAQWLADRSDIDAVIALGCLIEGETKHFDFIAGAVAQGLTQVGLQTRKPVAFGVLTTANEEQAFARAGGAEGNKGEEAALTVAALLEEQAKLADWPGHNT